MKPAVLALALVLVVFGCGGPPPMQPASAPEAATAGRPGPAPRYPLAEAMPADVVAFATMPGTAGLSDLVAQIVGGTDLLDLIGGKVAAATTLSRSAVTGFLRDLDRVAVGLTAERELLVALHASDDAAVDRLLTDGTAFELAGEHGGAPRYRLVSDRSILAGLALDWHRDRRLVLLGEEPALTAAARALGEGESLADDDAFAEAAKQFEADPAVNLYVHRRLVGEQASRRLPVEVLAPLVASLTLGDGVAFRTTTVIGGSALPPATSPVEPPALTLPATLPGDTIAFVAFSSRVGGPPETKGERLLGTLDGLNPGSARNLVGAGSALGIDVPRALSALGDEGAIGLVVPPGAKPGRAELLWEGALVIGRQKLRDRDAFASVVDEARDALAASKRVTVEPIEGGWFARSPQKNAGAAVAVRGDELVVTFGHGAGAKALVDARGPTLRDDEVYQRLGARFAGEHVGVWFDLQRTLDALSRNIPHDADELLSLPRTSGERPIGGLSFGWRPESRGWRVHATMHDAATLGVVSALMIYSVRRYLAASKVAEAKNTVAAIARGAVAAYEREHAGPKRHRLCESAEPVPAIVPSGHKYQPSSLAGEDFQRGDQATGWPCLKFSLTAPHYYRYTYRRGSGYLGPKRGGPDPGPNGFEVSAEGDLDGDGVTSLFTLAGKIDRTTGELVVSPQLFIDDELE